MQTLDQFARGKLKERDALKLRRAIVETDAGDGVRVIRNGRTLISFCSNDYLNLSQHPAVKAGQGGPWLRDLPLNYQGLTTFLESVLEPLRDAEKVR